MPFTFFPAVDDNFNFPTEVRLQLARSPELRNLVVPMTTAVRDGLLAEELWDGKVIYNTSLKKLQTYNKARSKWNSYLDDTYVFPPPPPFWDEDYNLPEEVGVQLSKHTNLRGLIQPMSLNERDALLSKDKWPGRVIFNITNNKLEIYLNWQWRELLDENFTLPTSLIDQFKTNLDFRNFIHILTQEERDALSYVNNQKWTGMVIFNTTTNQLEVCDLSDNIHVWLPVKDETVLEDSEFIYELSLTEELRNTITPMTTETRNSLRHYATPSTLWDGRVIYNTTTQQLECASLSNGWPEPSVTWNPIQQNSTDGPIWKTFNPTLRALEVGTISNWQSSGRYIKHDNMFSFSFTIEFSGLLLELAEHQWFYIDVPENETGSALLSDTQGTFLLETAWNSRFTSFMGNLIPPSPGSPYLCFSLFSMDQTHWTEPYVSSRWPIEIDNTSRITGQITYFK